MTRFKKNAKGRPLSQFGLIRQPNNAKQRNFQEGGLKKKEVHPLDDFNETQGERQLHPTNGFRKLSVRRSRAQAIMAEMRAGVSWPTKLMARFLKDGF